MGDLIQVREQLEPMMAPLAPVLERLLPPTLPPERLLQTLYVSIANNASLARATAPSLIQAASSAAVLGLEVDGVSGQGYLVPYKGRAQFLAGYKGMVTIAARSRRTLEGFLVRADEEFDFDEPNGLVRHRRRLGGEKGRRIIGAYAVSRGVGLPTLVRVLSIDELIETRDRSAGWKAKGEQSTWGTNFAAMCRKTPMRRLANDLPVLGLQQSAALDAQHDLGRHAWLHEDGGIVVDGRHEAPGDMIGDVRNPRPRSEVAGAQPGAGKVLDGELVGEWVVHFPGQRDTDTGGVERYKGVFIRALEKLRGQPPEKARKFIAANEKRVYELRETHPEVASILIDHIEAARE